MFRILVSLAILSLSYGNILKPKVPLLDGRIVGGENTNIQSHPHQVSVRLLGSHTCGGSILNSRLVVTAAHCIYDDNASIYSVQFGVTSVGNSKNVINAQRTLKHEKYNYEAKDYDVGLIFLSANIPFSSVAKPIALASKTPAAGTEAIVSGWGTLVEGGSNPAVLQCVGVVIVDRSLCASQYNDVKNITERMLCAGVNGGGKDSCRGDSGGPLAANGELVGIVSWGVGCARPEFSGVYTNVASLVAWIDENAK